MEPIYKPGVEPCAILRYGWTGWPALQTTFPAQMESFLASPSEFWEKDCPTSAGGQPRFTVGPFEGLSEAHGESADRF